MHEYDCMYIVYIGVYDEKSTKNKSLLYIITSECTYDSLLNKHMIYFSCKIDLCHFSHSHPLLKEILKLTYVVLTE